MTTTAPNFDQSCADAGQINIKVPQRNSHGFVTEWCIDEDAGSAKRPGTCRTDRSAPDAVDRAVSVIAPRDPLDISLQVDGRGESSVVARPRMEAGDSDSNGRHLIGTRSSALKERDVADGPQRGSVADPDEVESAEMAG